MKAKEYCNFEFKKAANKRLHTESCLFILYEQKQILTSKKGCNFATNFIKMALYNHNLDLINVNVYTKIGLIRFIL